MSRSIDPLEDPGFTQKNPHQTFLLVLSLWASLPLLQGRSSSAVLDRELNEFSVQAWGFCLLIGTLIALVGEFWRGRTWTALVIERAGLGLVGSAAAIYSGVVFYAVLGASTTEVQFAVGVTLAYALSCAWRVVQITGHLRFIKKMVEEINSEYRQ